MIRLAVLLQVDGDDLRLGIRPHAPVQAIRDGISILLQLVQQRRAAGQPLHRRYFIGLAADLVQLPVVLPQEAPVPGFLFRQSKQHSAGRADGAQPIPRFHLDDLSVISNLPDVHPIDAVGCSRDAGKQLRHTGDALAVYVVVLLVPVEH